MNISPVLFFKSLFKRKDNSNQSQPIQNSYSPKENTVSFGADVYRANLVPFMGKNNGSYTIEPESTIKTKTLSEEETYNLFKRYKNYNDKEAMDKLIISNERFVHFIAKKFSDIPNMEYDDLIGTGTIGLIKAVRTFDPDRVNPNDPSQKIKFPTYAARVINNDILMSLRKLDTNRGKFSKTKIYLKTMDELTIELQREPSSQEIYARMAENGIKLDSKSLSRIHDDLVGEIYLDAPVSEKIEEIFSSIIPDNSKNAADIIIENDEKEKLYKLIEQLPERERQVISLRYGLISGIEMNQPAIAKKLGISQSYITRIEQRALEYLRMLAENNKIQKTPLEKLLNKIEITEEEFKVRHSKLTNRERRVIELSYGLNDKNPKTMEEIAKITNISITNVSKIQKAALNQIKTNLYPDKKNSHPLEQLLDELLIGFKELKFRLTKLSDTERQVFKLHYGIPLTIKEIAQITGIPLKKIPIIINQALKHIETDKVKQIKPKSIKKPETPLGKFLDELLIGFEELKFRLTKLSDTERQVIKLYYGIPLTIKEIAEITGKTPVATYIIKKQAFDQIKTNSYKSQAPLKKLLKEIGIDEEEFKVRHSKLTDREKQVIELRYGLNNNNPKTLEETAKIMDIPVQSVSRIQRIALNQIRTNKFKEVRSKSIKKSPFEKLLNKLGIDEEEFKVRHSKLTDREKQVIELRYGLNDKNPRTLEETAKIMDIPVQNVSRIQRIALDQIKTNEFNFFKFRKRNVSRIQKLASDQINTYKLEDKAKEFKRRLLIDLKLLQNPKAQEMLNESLDYLYNKERTVIKLYYALEGKHHSVKEIGEIMNINNTKRVEKIKKDAIKKMLYYIREVKIC